MLQELHEVMRSKDYEDMVRDSAKKNEEEIMLKRKKIQTRLVVKRGRYEHHQKLNTKLAQQYADGTLQDQLAKAEQEYGCKKHAGVALLLKAPLLLVEWTCRVVKPACAEDVVLLILQARTSTDDAGSFEKPIECSKSQEAR